MLVFAIVSIMLVHTLWATVVIITKKENMLQKFHKYSIIIGIIWLRPFITGMILNLR